MTHEIDLESGLGWALASRGRVAQALRVLLASVARPGEILQLSVADATTRTGESAESLVPILHPSAVPGVKEQRILMQKAGARLLLLGSTGYPTLLREISDPPAVLFGRGKDVPAGLAVAIVGSRRASRAGLDAARQIAGELARAGVTIVSGFARGIDAAAHESALRAGGGTVAVLGCGVDVCYPAEQRRLFQELVEKGTVLSEFPMGEQPKPFHFPIRNRIIAGLAHLTLVVEAAERSGSLITARLAMEYGRDVAACPGAAMALSAAGSNSLLKDGAILVRNAADVLAELPGALAAPTPRERELTALLGDDERLVLGVLDPDDPRDADALVAATGLDAGRLSAALVGLELEGLAAALPGAVFVRRRGGA